MSTFLGLLIIFGFITFTAYEIIGIVRTVKERKKEKSKIHNKGDDTE